MAEEIKSFRNRNMKVLFPYANLLFNSTSKTELFICDNTYWLSGVVAGVLQGS